VTTSSLLRAAPAAMLLALGGDWEIARPDYRWSFPRDHWAHPAYRTEWWYFTGHLTAAGDTAPRFGYQFTVFRIGLLPARPALASDWAASMVIMGHAAITDLGAGEHRFSETLYRAVPLLGGFGEPGDSLIAWSRAPAGTDGRWTLTWTGAGFDFAMRDAQKRMAFALRTAPRRPLVFEGPNGFSRKGAGETAASLYYSFTRLATTGTLTLDDASYVVSGTTWMDQEIGSNQLDRAQVGWDWFSFQLDDGRDLMLYALRDSTGGVSWAGGTLVPREGAPEYLARDAFTVTATEHWESPQTRAPYPSRWRVTVRAAGLDLDVVPTLADQENRSALATRLFYWEGAVQVRDRAGRARGRGYVELTGYGTGARPAF
jgi:predicted secreted hydrolase